MKLIYLVFGVLLFGVILYSNQDEKQMPSISGGWDYHKNSSLIQTIPAEKSQYQRIDVYPSIPSRIGIRKIGEVDCTVINITTGHGPYSLICEIDGDDIRINFPNGGFLIVDSDGHHYSTGHDWDIEIN